MADLGRSAAAYAFINPTYARSLSAQRSGSGTPIHALYKPIKLGSEGNRWYLSVSPDLYHTGQTTLTEVRRRIQAAGLPRPDEKRVREIVRQQDGYPHFLGTFAR